MKLARVRNPQTDEILRGKMVGENVFETGDRAQFSYEGIQEFRMSRKTRFEFLSVAEDSSS